MNPRNDATPRPVNRGASNVETITTEADDYIVRPLDDLRRRRAEAWRCAPLEDGRRDPLDATPREAAPATYGLDPDDLLELARHHWRTYGWQPWECRARFAIGEAA